MRPEDDSRAQIERARRLAWLLDNSIRLPGGFRIGLDAIIGLFPGIGDALGSLLSAYIVLVAARSGVGGATLARMVFNVALEGVVGALPVLGDLFDAAWKANAKNTRLLDDYLANPRRVTRRSRLRVIFAAVVLLLLLALIGAGIVAVMRWLLHAAGVQ